MKIPHITGGFLLAIYSTLGCFVLLFTMALWYEGQIELGLPTIYQLTRGDAILRSLYSIIGFLPIFIITNSVGQINRISETNKPLAASIFNSVVTIAVYLSISFFAVGFTPLCGFPMIFAFVNGGIVGVSTYFHVIIPIWKKSKSDNPLCELEVLKLEHDWIWKAINTISQATLIILVSVWIVIFYQISLSVVPVEKRLELGFMKLMSTVAFQATYVLAGLFFGIIAKLWSYSTYIRERVSQLKLSLAS